MKIEFGINYNVKGKTEMFYIFTLSAIILSNAPVMNLGLTGKNTESF